MCSQGNPQELQAEPLPVPRDTVGARANGGALARSDPTVEDDATLLEFLFRAGQSRAPGTEGLSAAYLAHERALAAEHALYRHRESRAGPEIEISWCGFLPRPERR